MNPQEAKVYFKGILANVDSSILQMDFNHGFKIESFSDEEATTFFENLEKIPRMTIAEKYFMRYGCLNFSEQRMYAISKLFENMSTLDFPEIARFDNTLVLGYLDPTIRLMRLFKEGDIRMPVKFYYRVQNNEIERHMSGTMGRYISHEPYHLEAFEVPILQNFIHGVKLPFQRDFVQLAFENFELSYEISDIQLAFVVLMIGLEALLNPAYDEVRYRVSRNTAVLLGEDREKSEEILTLVKKLYDKRSEIIHSGKRKIVEKVDLLTLRDYVRRAIKEIYYIDKEKNKIMNLLNSYGFGEKIEKS
jgi:hypothetical protein